MSVTAAIEEAGEGGVNHGVRNLASCWGSTEIYSFLIWATVYYYATAGFVHAIGLYHYFNDNYEPTLHYQLSSYAFYFIIVFFLYKMEFVKPMPHLHLGCSITCFGWSMLQRITETDVFTVDKASLKTACSRGATIFLYSVAAILLISVLGVRSFELCQRRNDLWSKVKRGKNRQYWVAGISLFIVAGIAAKIKPRQYLVGLVLNVIMAGSSYKICVAGGSFGFGLYTQAVTVWCMMSLW